MIRWTMLVMLAGCAPTAEIHDAGRDAGRDAPSTVDAPASDVGTDSGADAPPVFDAGRDAPAPELDAGTDAGWPCSIVPQAGCAAGFTCRLSAEPGITPWFGVPSCQRVGTRIEGQVYSPPSCRAYDAATDASVDLCQAGLYCGHSECYRYCDPAGPPCPILHGSPQRCSTDANSIIATIYDRWGLGTCAP